MTSSDTDAARWDNIESLFQQAIELDPDQRKRFLEEQCTDDTKTLRAVLNLLDHDEGTDSFIGGIELPITKPMKSMTRASADVLSQVGTQIGRYKLVHPIGVGGMGTVWLAERVDGEFQQKVAVKLINSGLDNDDILHRFRNERQLLANFKHPNIVRLLDGGAAADGRPYFVMEFVDGVPIDQFCNDHKQSIHQRLQLFQRVCAAIHVAHQNLIVHRDLKPSNILVMSNGEPKLLDFGIAKVLHPNNAREASMTVTGLRLMTPRYASPEQIRGEAITTASDVYSLGVILYELLTGCRPYNVRTGSRHELERVVIDQEPTRPSIIVNRSVSRGDDSESTRTRCGLPDINTRRLSKSLIGDLDTIVMTALRKEPERRYGTAEELASDIARYLRNDPITARADTWRYRSSKFVRRNRTGVTAAALLFIVIMTGLVASLVLYTRAEDARAVAVTERDEAEWNLYVASISAADGVLTDVYYPRKAMRHLNAAPEHHRAWEWNFLASLVDRSLVDIAPKSTGNRKIRIAWQPGGTLLASAEGVGPTVLRIYDGRTGDRIADLGTIHNSRINSISFSPDGRRLATIALDASFTSWSIDGLDFRLEFSHTFDFPANGFEFNHDGNAVFVRGNKGSVRAFAINDGKLLPLWSYQSGFDTSLNLAEPNASNIIVVGTPSSLLVLDAGTGEVLRSTEVEDRPGPLRIVDDQQIMGVVGNDVLTWDMNTLDLIDVATIRVKGNQVKVRFHPNHRFIGFQSGNTHHFALGNLEKARIETNYHGYREFGIVQDLHFSDDGERVAVASWERTLETWDVSGTPSVRKLRWVHSDTGESEHFSTIDTLADGSLIAAGSQGGVSLWEPRTGLRVRVLRKKDQRVVNGVRLHADGHRVVSTSNGELDVWDVHTGERLWTIKGASTHRKSIDTSPDGKYLAYVEPAKGGGFVHLCDWDTGEIIRTYPRPKFGARCVAFSPDGTYLACGTSGGKPKDSRVVIWNVETGEIVRELAGFERIIEAVAWSPDGAIVAACGYRKGVWLWSMDTGEVLPKPVFGEGVYRCWDVYFTPDGKRLIVANTSDSLRLWDHEHGEEIFQLGFVSGSREVTMPQDQRWMAVAARWVISIWDTSSPAERVIGEVVRRRILDTPDDWSTIIQNLETDRWLTDTQRAEAIELAKKIQQLMTGSVDSASEITTSNSAG